MSCHGVTYGRHSRASSYPALQNQQSLCKTHFEIIRKLLQPVADPELQAQKTAVRWGFLQLGTRFDCRDRQARLTAVDRLERHPALRSSAKSGGTMCDTTAALEPRVSRGASDAPGRLDLPVTCAAISTFYVN